MIRNAQVKDIEAMLDIYDDYVLNTGFTFEYEVPTVEDFLARVTDTQKQYPWLVAEVDSKVVGYAYGNTVFKRAAYQWNVELSIYIDNNYHHKGIATALYFCLEELLLEQGYHNLFGVITSENQKSLDLVKKLGFTEAGYFKDVGFKLGRWLDVSWLVKNIKHADAAPCAPVPFKSLDKGLVQSVFAKHAKTII